MASAWRLTKTKLLSGAWDGQGAKKSGGRWNSVGIAVVYTSSTLSLALVEVLVHLPSGILPAYSAVRVDFDESMVAAVEPRELPKTGVTIRRRRRRRRSATAGSRRAAASSSGCRA